jgi:hypothetical protein
MINEPLPKRFKTPVDFLFQTFHLYSSVGLIIAFLASQMRKYFLLLARLLHQKLN